MKKVIVYKDDQLPQKFLDAGITEIAVAEGTDLNTIDVNDLVKRIEEQTKEK